MAAQTKLVDLKLLLDKIEKVSASSPELAKELLKELQVNSEHFREMDRQALQAQVRVTYLG